MDLKEERRSIQKKIIEILKLNEFDLKKKDKDTFYKKIRKIKLTMSKLYAKEKLLQKSIKNL